MRTRTRWNKRAKVPTREDIARVLSVTCWKIATNNVLELENQGCHTHSNQHRLQLISEFLVFLLHIVDRLMMEQLPDEDRQSFIFTLAWRLTDTYDDNQRDVVGPGEYRKAFIDLLNQRGAEYSEFTFQDGEADFDLLRYFSEQVATLLEKQTWIREHLMSVAGPEAIKILTQNLHDLFKPLQLETENPPET